MDYFFNLFQKTLKTTLKLSEKPVNKTEWLSFTALSIQNKTSNQSQLPLKKTSKFGITLVKNQDKITFSKKWLFEPSLLSQSLLVNNQEKMKTWPWSWWLLMEMPSDTLSIFLKSYFIRFEKKYCMIAVKQNGLAIEHVEKNMKMDMDVCEAAFNQNPMSIKFMHPNIRKNEDFCFTCVRENGLTLQFMDVEIQTNKDIVVEAVLQNPKAFLYADQQLQDDLFFTRLIVRRCVECYPFIKKEYQSDQNCYIIAARKSEIPKEYCSIDVQNHPFVRKVIRQKSNIAEFNSDLTSDYFYMSEVCEEDGSLLEFASEEIKNDKEIVLQAVRSYPLSLQWVSDELKNDKTVVIMAVIGEPKAIIYASQDLQLDQDIIYCCEKSY